jgi:hypothetical protein
MQLDLFFDYAPQQRFTNPYWYEWQGVISDLILKKCNACEQGNCYQHTR